MKKILCAFIAVLMLLACLTACTEPGGEGEETTDQSSLGVYAGLVDLLRAELDALKKAQSEDAAEYEEKIKELEDKIEKLTETELPQGTTAKPSTDTEAPEDDGIPFTYTESGGKITITGRKNEAIKVLVIPAEIDGKPVVAIADNAFSGTDITGITLPAGMTEIGWFAFFGCVSLMNVNIPSSVGLIGYDAFANCPKLTIYCPSGSYSEKYAKSYGLSVVST